VPNDSTLHCRQALHCRKVFLYITTERPSQAGATFKDSMIQSYRDHLTYLGRGAPPHVHQQGLHKITLVQGHPSMAVDNGCVPSVQVAQ
jgi:hypothetical protein